MKAKEICCGGDILFEPYSLRNLHDKPLVRLYCDRKRNHQICLGKCGNPSSCPYCSGQLEFGRIICPVCKFIVGEGLRDRNGDITVTKRDPNVGPIYDIEGFFRESVIARGED